jgi:hypothetical protein
MSLVDKAGAFLAARTTRRSFIARTTLAATAMSVGPLEFLLKPVAAYAYLCSQCASPSCNCDQLCCDGYTQFCCTINSGVNACPEGTFAGGWWKADGSVYCSGARYYIDCMGECHGCSCGGGNFCPSCDDMVCECALNDCNNRHVGCALFRYGQCNEQISCSGRISCRVVSCTPPWELYPSCSTVSYTDDSTANHYAPCQDGPPPPPPPPPNPADLPVVGMAVTKTGLGYWMVNQAGYLNHYGDATDYGDLSWAQLAKPVVDIAATATGAGYWMVCADGGIFTFGAAQYHGSLAGYHLNKPIVGMAPDVVTGGYWMDAADGGAWALDAPFEGSAGAVHLNQPAVGMAATPTGKGYWIVCADGGIFTFGDAQYLGSTGAIHLNQPAVGMAATPTGKGYWIVCADGGIFTFGDAKFYGCTADIHLSKPAVGMAATPTGLGYWIVCADGGIFTFGDARYYGSKPGG